MLVPFALVRTPVEQGNAGNNIFFAQKKTPGL
jgi:hypothetical protein